MDSDITDRWRVNCPENARTGVLMAHGAGAGMDHVFMQTMAERLCSLGLLVVRFEFDYMTLARETGKRRPPDRMPKLTECFERQFHAVVEAYPDVHWFLGGKSMGGRVAATVQPEIASAGVVCLGYPFHPPKKVENLRLEPLQQLTERDVLIVQGTRDSLGNRQEVDGYSLPPTIQIKWLEDGDHDLKPRKRSGFTHEQHIESAAACIAEFCGSTRQT